MKRDGPIGSDSSQPYLWMLSGSASFALMVVIASELNAYCDWQVVAITRSGMALLFAAILAYVAGARFVFFRPRVLWLRSIAGSCSMVCTFYALDHLRPSDVLTLTQTFPIWVALLSWPLVGEAPGRSVWLAVGCSVAGVAIIQQAQLEPNNLATLAAAGAAIFTAIAMLGLHRLRAFDSRAIVVHFSGVALAFCIAALFLFPRKTAAKEFAPWPLLLLLGLGLCATIGQIFLTKAFAHGSPTRVSIVGLSQVVFGLLLELGLQGKDFRPHAVLGSMLVILPTAWVIASSGHSAGHAIADGSVHEPDATQVCETT